MRFDPTHLTRYGWLTLTAREIVEGFLSGVHKSPYKGFSVEFAEHRQYFPGDEIRHIDWRVYGKTDRYYVKEFEEETNLKANLLVDASGSMAYRGNRVVSKFEYAQFVAGSLAYLMLHQLDAVGLITHDTKVRRLMQPRAQSKHLLHLLKALEETKPGGETSLAPLWHDLAGKLQHRGLIIILSDCFDKIELLLHALRHLRHRRQEILLLHILAPEEIEFPFQQWTQFRDLERSAHRLLVDPGRLRRDYLANFNSFCQQLREQTARMNIDYHLMRTDQPVDRALGIYLSRRQSQR